MKIHLYSTCYNEELMIPYYLRYYQDQVDKIFIFDNESTDSSRSIFKTHPKVTLFSFSTTNQVNDVVMKTIYSEAYKKYSPDADWVMCCDIDEFLVCDGGLRYKLQQYLDAGVIIPKIVGFQMIAEDFVISDKQIYEVCDEGVRYPTYDKPSIFRPFVDIKYRVGLHGADPGCDRYIYSSFDWITLLHYKFFGRQRAYERNKLIQARLSESNIKHNYGKVADGEDFTAWFNNFYKLRDKIIG